MNLKIMLNNVLLVACVFPAFVSFPAYAEVIELEGTIKSIDAEKREITIGRKTPKGEKLLELGIASNAGDISGFREGDKISFAFNPDAEIITMIKSVAANAERGLSAEEQSVVGNWKSRSGKEGKTFKENRVVLEWDENGIEFNRGVWLLRKDGSLFAGLSNNYTIEGNFVTQDVIEFTVFDPQHKIIEKLRMSRVK